LISEHDLTNLLLFRNDGIESVLWDGSRRIVFKQLVSQPFDLTIL
jgi:hypothetical protein